VKQPMVIFTRSFDFVHWLIPRTMDFPRSQRFVVTKRLQDAALDFYEHLTVANQCRGRHRLQSLRKAEVALDKTRHYLRMAATWGWLSGGQYQHAAQMLTELGRLLGGWIKQTGAGKPSADRGAAPEGTPGVARGRVQQ